MKIFVKYKNIYSVLQNEFRNRKECIYCLLDSYLDLNDNLKIFFEIF